MYYNLTIIGKGYDHFNYRLMLGVMLTSWFLSIWISNTATTAMMLPIVAAILNQLKCNNNYNKSGKDLGSLFFRIDSHIL